eukprot:gene49951-66906_t
MIQAAARNIATSGDHRQIPAYEQPVTELALCVGLVTMSTSSFKRTALIAIRWLVRNGKNAKSRMSRLQISGLTHSAGSHRILCATERFGKELPKDAALVLAQHMAQWNYISAMNDYDVVVLSMSAIMFGSFSPKPTVVLPL